MLTDEITDRYSTRLILPIYESTRLLMAKIEIKETNLVVVTKFKRISRTIRIFNYPLGMNCCTRAVGN